MFWLCGPLSGIEIHDYKTQIDVRVGVCAFYIILLWFQSFILMPVYGLHYQHM
jgi:hypothetical protein